MGLAGLLGKWNQYGFLSEGALTVLTYFTGFHPFICQSPRLGPPAGGHTGTRTGAQRGTAGSFTVAKRQKPHRRKLGKYTMGTHSIGENAEIKKNKVAVEKNQVTPIHLIFKRIKSICNNTGGPCLSLKKAEKQNGAEHVLRISSGSRSWKPWLFWGVNC